MCRINASNHDDPCSYGMFQCDPPFEYALHMESDFYVSRVQPKRMVMCCHYDATMLDSPTKLHAHLIFAKRARLYRPTDRYARHVSVAGAISLFAKANTKKAKLDAECAREVVRQKMATS